MSLRRTAASLLVTFLALSSASPAAAQYSMAGKWGFEPSYGSYDLDLVQSGGTLTWTGYSDPVGTINESTGEFHLDFGMLTYPGCGPHLIDGFVALDSRTFTGTISFGQVEGPTPHFLHCDYGAYPIVGSRCGNGELDPGEVCEDDNGLDGDCCSSMCQYDTPGTSCTTDYNQCTDDTCDEAGTCLHTNNTAPCSSSCMDGTCTAGDCVTATPSPAGTACNADNDYCTDGDACDGAGTCAPGGPRDCGPCGVCDWTGCRSPEQCEMGEAPAGPASLKLSIGEEAGDARLAMKMKDVIPSADLGNPTTDMHYRVCIAQRDDSFLGIPRPVLAFDLPVGGTCGTRDCWKSTSSGFVYKDRATSSDGVSAFAAGERGFKIKGKGEQLSFGAALPIDTELPVDGLIVQVISDDGVTTKCRAATLTPTVSSATEYSGQFKPE